MLQIIIILYTLYSVLCFCAHSPFPSLLTILIVNKKQFSHQQDIIQMEIKRCYGSHVLYYINNTFSVMPFLIKLHVNKTLLHCGPSNLGCKLSCLSLYSLILFQSSILKRYMLTFRAFISYSKIYK